MHIMYLSYMYPPLRLMFGWLPDACQHYLVLGKFPSLLAPSTCCCCCCLKLTHCSTRHRLDPLLALNGTCESPYIAQKSTLGVMLVDQQLGLGSRMWSRWMASTHPPQLKMVVSTMAFGSMAAWYHLPAPHGGVKHLESASSRRVTATLQVSSMVQRLLVGLGLGARPTVPLDPETDSSQHGEGDREGDHGPGASSPESARAQQGTNSRLSASEDLDITPAHGGCLRAIVRPQVTTRPWRRRHCATSAAAPSTSLRSRPAAATCRRPSSTASTRSAGCGSSCRTSTWTG